MEIGLNLMIAISVVALITGECIKTYFKYHRVKCSSDSKK